jgi:anti-sigma B factor antagonist
MELAYRDLADGVRLITLRGRLDVQGAQEVDLTFTALTATQQFFVVVDLADVEFLASIGLSTLVHNARIVRLRAGNMVLINPRPNVHAVLTSSRIHEVIPICCDLEEALLTVKAPPAPIG